MHTRVHDYMRMHTHFPLTMAHGCEPPGVWQRKAGPAHHSHSHTVSHTVTHARARTHTHNTHARAHTGHLVSGYVKQHLPIILVNHLTTEKDVKKALTQGEGFDNSNIMSTG